VTIVMLTGCGDFKNHLFFIAPAYLISQYFKYSAIELLEVREGEPEPNYIGFLS